MITIDYQSKTPLYEQIMERFQMLIIRGALKPDEQMPSVRSLALKLSINPNTIQKAYTLLEKSGYIYAVKGKGNYVSAEGSVARRKKDEFFREMKKFIRYGTDLGISPDEFYSHAKEIYEDGGTV